MAAVLSTTTMSCFSAMMLFVAKRERERATEFFRFLLWFVAAGRE